MGDLSLKALSDGITGTKHILADAINKTVTENGTFAQTEAKFNSHVTDNTAHGLGTHIKNDKVHLGGVCQFVSRIDLNTLCIDTGFYMGDALQNAPTQNWYYIEVLVHRNDSNGWCLQRLTDFNDDRYVWTRERRNGTWGTWNCLFQFANDGKTSVANVIGSPSVATETFAQLSIDIQNLKNNFANYLNNKGQPSNGTDTLNNLIWRVSQINTGKRFANGKNNYNSNKGDTTFVTINLPFTPTIIISYYYVWCQYSHGHGNYIGVWNHNGYIHYWDCDSDKDGGGIHDMSNTGPVQIGTNSILLRNYGQTNYECTSEYDWIAFE